IGQSDLALGQGGASMVPGVAASLSSGFAWLNQSYGWGTSPGAALPAGTYDFISVLAHEAGHALGLGHNDNLGGQNIMDAVYSGQLSQASAADTAVVQQLYPPGAATAPVTTA